MIIDWRALCVDLVDWADYTSAHYYAPPEVLVRAHSALAEADEPAVSDDREPASVIEDPSDEELLELWQGWNLGWDPQKGPVLMPHPAEYARAVLARWGNYPAKPDSSAPAAGEALVTDELVRQLRTKAATEKSNRCHYSAILLNRAADILERQHPQPVPVSERLPGPEDCDAEGRCWWYGEGGDMVGWTLDAEGPSYYRAKYWLPAHALQAPAGGATIG